MRRQKSFLKYRNDEKKALEWNQVKFIQETA